jgi:hypothetical protein
MLIGRLPVNTPAEVQAVVDKIVRYEAAPEPGAWNARLAFVSDDPDPAGDFPAQSQALASSYIDPPFAVDLITVAAPVTVTQQAVRDRWEAGAGLMVFNGHASIHQWAVERAFHLDDAAALANGRRLPVVLELTCFTGSFHLPGLPALDEALVRRPDGGAVAVWGPTGLGVARGHLALAQGFLRRVYVDGQDGLGAAALAGKLNLAAEEPIAADLLDTFTLLGDPATRINLTSSLFLPLIRR